MSISKTTHIRRDLLAASALTGLAVFAQPAVAQDDNSGEDTIVVTGSRIPQANLTTSSPVTQVNADEFLYRGVTRVEDLINDLPQVLANNTSGDSNGATGTANIDLRGLGIERTLVLVNGRRLPIGSPQSGASAADINFIPGSLVERVEVLTGGASATYGSDAIGGVVNFILQDDFEGIRFDYQYGVYQHNNNNSEIQAVVGGAGFDFPTGGTWGGGIHDFSATIGANTGDGRGNVTGYMTYRNVKEVLQGERDYSACALTGSAGSFGCGGSSTTPLGRFTDFGLNDATAGQVNFDTELNQTTGALDPFGTLYNYNPLNFYQRPDERITGGFFGHYEINRHADVYASFMFMDDRSAAQIAPTGTFFSLSTIPCSNVLFTAEQFDLFCTQQGLTAADNANLFIGRRNVEGGGRLSDIRHTQWRSVLGVRGEINDNWTYDLFAMYGEVSHTGINRNDFFIPNLANALDVVDDGMGNAVCQSVLDGTDPACVPYNIFTPGGVTQAALNYLQVPSFQAGGTEQTTVSGYIAGDLGDWGMQFPGASPIQTVLGFEYREEFLNFEPDAILGAGNSTGLGGPTLPASGRLDVYEFFTELRIPIIEGREFFEELSFDGAYRFSTYSTDVDTHTYKLAATWAPSTDMKFRGSFQRAVRHPNVRELFRPAGIGLFDLDEGANGQFDPCSGPTPARSLADCMNTGVTAAQYGFIADSPAGQFNEITGGNANLDPEESDTFSAGVVLTPGFMPGFNLTVDWFSIDVQNAIDEIPSPTILTQCLDTGDATFCDAINRGVTGNGTLWLGGDNITSLDVNLGFFKTTGIDFNGSYSMDTGAGDLNFNWVATWLMSWEQQPFPGAAIEACEGIFNSSCGAPRPEFTSNFRTTWGSPWGADVTVNWRYIGSVGGAETFDSVNYIDFAAIYPVNENVTLRAGVNNVFDVEPPLTSSAGPSIFGNGNTFPGVYDALGRFVFAGATVSF